jgi:hypothetical protein
MCVPGLGVLLRVLGVSGLTDHSLPLDFERLDPRTLQLIRRWEVSHVVDHEQ